MNLAGFNSVGLVTRIPEMSPKTNIAKTVTLRFTFYHMEQKYFSLYQQLFHSI